MTAEATVLVEENHNLIYGYLHRMRLSIEEYYVKLQIHLTYLPGTNFLLMLISV